MAECINVALIGCRFMGRAHSNGYRQVARFFDPPVEPGMKVVCDVDRGAVMEAAGKLGWQEWATDWRKVIARNDIGLVDVCTPNFTHAEIAMAAAHAGKHVLCEKPLAMDLAQARQMLRAVRQAGVKHMVDFNYRTVPAVALAKQLIEQGRLGEIYHFRAAYLQDWIVDPKFPLVWRMQKERTGSGAHGDLNAHIIDLAHFLVGEMEQVVGEMVTFIKRRPRLAAADAGLGARGTERMGRVTVDDAAAFIARFRSGAMGTFEATRFAAGRRNRNGFEINGSKGSLSFDLERMNELLFFSREDPPALQGWRDIMVTDGTHPYVGAWWPAGHIIGYEHTFVHTVRNFMEALGRGENPSPSFEDGVRCQAVLEAVEESVQSRGWVRVPQTR